MHLRTVWKTCALVIALAVQGFLGPAALAGDRVWVNTGSGVYHCLGTRYYGNTKRGRFASEAEAIAAGNRPAHGTRCN